MPVPTLQEKVVANAAVRLKLPPGRLPCEELDRFRRFLKVETQRLRIFHRGGGGGREVCAGRAVMIDVLLQRVFESYLDVLSPGTGAREPLTVVALGGYGRAELNPCSDVDIVLLHDHRSGDPSPLVRGLMEKFVPFLWSVGLECHPLVRTLDDCVREAHRRMESKTALLEARRVWGDARLFEQMRILLADRCLKGREDDYVAERMTDQEQRHAKWGHSYCLLEPNVKAGCGGLRDYQSLRWMAVVKYRVTDLPDLMQRGLLTAASWKQLDQAYDFLLRVRNELHYHQGRKTDLLTRPLQPAVAHGMGYPDRSQARRVERFMGDVYRHTRALHLVTRNLERRLALRPPGRLARLGRLFQRRPNTKEPLADGFLVTSNELAPRSSRIFKEQPRRLMRAFLLAQQRGLQLHPDLEDLIRQNVPLVTRDFLRDPHIHETFLEILNQRGNVARIVRAMHETDFLAKYLPPFRQLTCRVQHEFYHLYSADEHTLVCLEMLDRVWNARDEPFRHYSELFRQLDRPYLLYLALLLHDVGKASDSRDHAVESARLAVSTARRMNLSAAATNTVTLLVRHHLLMVRLSQKLDLDDPEVIRQFATTVQSPENLQCLTLHTFADSMGTSSSLWTAFKESLLWTLYRRTEQMLTGDDQFQGAQEERRRRLVTDIRRLVPRTFHPDEIEAHFTNLPERYLDSTPPREIASDLVLAHRFMWNQLAEDDRTLEPVIGWHNEPDRGHAVVKVCTWDRPRLFNRIAGALAAARINILAARIFSRRDGPVFDTLHVNDPTSSRLPDREARERFEELLTASLRGQSIDFPALIARHGPTAPLYNPATYESIPTRVNLDNTLARGLTVIETEAPDRVGLLYAVTHTLAQLELNVIFARINTEKGAALDTFYVTESQGGAITGRDRRREVESALHVTLEGPR